ncbi:hypothetical protein Bca4012_072433 [Brassica carinata]|uniref:DUF287 domain-containing protein n=1 Tax=Brassica carinata TaxID=52824 RepID=A0A8X7U8Z0_BRACI|nr:hypothetical protein Bca52824_064827 [Brassica carinata]
MYSRKLRQLLVKKGLNRANVLQFHLVEHHHRKRRRKKTQASRNFQVSMRDLMKKLKKRRVVLKLSEPVAYGEENDGEDEVGSADVPEDKELEGVVEGDKDVAEEGKEDDDNDEEFEPTKAIKPSRMFFYHTEYKKQIKLETRCLIVDVIQTFKTLKPEMCQSTFKKTEMKGNPLASVNRELDSVKVSDDVDVSDLAVESWEKRISEGYPAFFKVNAEEAVLEDIGREEEVAEQKKLFEDVIQKLETIGDQLEAVVKTQEKFEERLGALESAVKESKKEKGKRK